MVTNSQFFDKLQISDISVISGIRPLGRMVDHSTCGRNTCGVVYVFDGETVFSEEGKADVVVSSEEMAYLPKGIKYQMRYTAEQTTFVVVNFELRGESGEDVSLFSKIALLGKDDMTHRIAKIMTAFELCGVSKTVEALLRKKELLCLNLRIWKTFLSHDMHRRATSVSTPSVLCFKNSLAPLL